MNGSTTRVDMHCHSTASEVSKLGVQRALGLPECATPPEEVYELAKRRGMDFVTITDHDTIDGVLAIADRDDVFVSEELTAHFRGEPQAVHVLCYGITIEDHEWLQANSGDVELCAMYLYDREIACALAHPYYAVGAPLTARHRRLSAVAELDVPFYPGLRIGVPSLSAAVQTLTDGAFDAIHVCSPGPAGIAGALLARALGLPLIGSYHTELTAYAELRSGRRGVADAMEMAVGAFYGACDLVLSPSPASDAALARIGMAPEKVVRWDRGVDTSRFDPSLRSERLRESWMGGLACPGDSTAQRRVPDRARPRRECSEVRAHDASPPARAWGEPIGGNNTDTGKPVVVLYAGRITREKGVELLADAFLAARERDPRLRLVLAGDGPERERVRERVGEHATFLGWLHGAELAEAYASADLFLFPSATDTFGQVILEAQASGLPVIAVAAGGPLALVEDRVNGLLCEPDAGALADALVELAGSPLLRERLARVALSAVRERTWERAMERLAAGYRRALDAARPSTRAERWAA